MLGIRHIDGVALDFWVGAPRFFYCDASYVFEGDEQKFSEFKPQSSISDDKLMPTSKISDFNQIKLGEGHIAFSPSSDTSPKELMDFVENSIIGSHKGRVTMILPTIEIYEPYFEEFGKRFPEEV